MVLVNPDFERGIAVGQVFKPHPEFFGLFEATFRVIVGIYRTIDLSAGREVEFDGTAGESVGVNPLRSGRPSDEHKSIFARITGSAKLKDHLR